MSSANPEKVSATIKGILLQYVGIALLISQALGHPLMESNVVLIIGDVTSLIGIALSFFGLARKLYLLIKEK